MSSETMSSPSDWAQFYQPHQTLSSSSQMLSSSSGINIDPTLITNIASSVTSSGGPSSTMSQLSPDGRVSKPARRRSRASRRTPTTLLNTDTTNFRAMVQQFTGGPGGAPFGSSSAVGQGGGAPPFSLGTRQGGHQINHPGSIMLPPPGYRLQYQHQQAQNQPWMISLGSNNHNQGEHHQYHHQGQGFHVQRGGNMENISDGGGFVMGNVPSSSSSSSSQQHVTGPVRAPPTNENRFMF
ncbi:hypothetical protein Ddye_018709 [Dipteronia dyeriana]|uniref:VQ domain-containing protein n=1 Tax=Dipteronia dyeriana TaxID=168575 RepID=A0AAD9UBX2_9ROSI|nr:hypothetical protein Ddye_018709 [Dipteronia dyeriana]